MTQSFKAEFPETSPAIYFNSANLSLRPMVIQEAQRRYQDEFEKNPTQGLREVWGKLWSAQKSLARFLNARPEDLFLRPNVTSVLNAFLMGLPLERGDEIVTGELEYGAIVNICRLRAQQEGLGLRVIKFPSELTPEKVTETILSQLGPKTKILLLSHVIGAHGLVLPVREIAEETRARGIAFVVDGAYAVGALPIDFEELSSLDAYGCSLYKWMAGPKGAAFGWVHPRRQNELRPVAGGWTTFDSWGPFQHFGDGSRFASQMSLSGCQDFSPYLAIQDTIALWEKHGADHIREKMLGLAGLFRSRIGWKTIAPPHPSPIVTALLPDADQNIAQDLWEKYQIQANATCLSGKWGLTFSFHAYNTEAEIEEALRRLQKFTSEAFRTKT